MFVLKLALRPWRLAPLSQLFSALAVGILLVLAGFLLSMQAGLKPVVARLAGEQVITAYIDPSVDPKDEGKLVDSIRLSLGAHAEPAEVTLVTSPQFLDALKRQYAELSRELEDLGPEMSTVIPRYVSVTGILPDSALERIKTVQGVESAESSRDRHRHVVGAFSALRWVSKVMAAGICLALFTGLLHLARMNAYLHRDALSVLRLWGAGEGLLKAPSLISGLSVGLLGGALAAMSWLSGGLWLARHVRALSPMLKDMPVSGAGFGLTLLVAGALIGMLAGLLGESRA